MLDIKELEKFVKNSNSTGVLDLRGSGTDLPSNLKELNLKGPSFEKLLNQENQLLKSRDLKFSGHAVNRLYSRNIQFTEAERAKISEGVEKLFDKGAKDALMLYQDTALIVNVPNKTVVTVLDKSGSSGEGIFTNIDSTMVL